MSDNNKLLKGKIKNDQNLDLPTQDNNLQHNFKKWKMSKTTKK